MKGQGKPGREVAPVTAPPLFPHKEGGPGLAAGFSLGSFRFFFFVMPVGASLKKVLEAQQKKRALMDWAGKG